MRVNIFHIVLLNGDLLGLIQMANFTVKVYDVIWHIEKTLTTKTLHLKLLKEHSLNILRQRMAPHVHNLLQLIKVTLYFSLIY